MDIYIQRYQGGTEPPGGEKTEEEKRGEYVNTVWLVDCKKSKEQQASVLKAFISPSNYYFTYAIMLYIYTIQTKKITNSHNKFIIRGAIINQDNLIGKM